MQMVPIAINSNWNGCMKFELFRSFNYDLSLNKYIAKFCSMLGFMKFICSQFGDPDTLVIIYNTHHLVVQLWTKLESKQKR